jgi:integrase
MAKHRARWRRVWLKLYKGKRGTTFRIYRHDSATGNQKLVRTFRNRRLAEKYRGDLELFINGQGPDPELETIRDEPDPEPAAPVKPWSDVVDTWLKNSPVKAKTRREYRYVGVRFGDYLTAQDPPVATPAAIEEKHVAGFLAGLKANRRTASTTAAYLRALAAWLRWEILTGPTHPISDRLIAAWNPYRKRKKQRPHVYSDDEYQNLLAAADGVCKGRHYRDVRYRASDRTAQWWEAFVCVLYWSAFRLEEVGHLIWRDVDFEAKRLHIRPHHRLPGVLPWSPKGKARRSVPVPDEVFDKLSVLQEAQPTGQPYVFLTSDRYAVLSGRLARGEKLPDLLLPSVSAGFSKLRARAGILEGTIHDLRRTRITRWARNRELSPKDVQILAGHEDLTTTLNIYAEVEEGEVVDKADRVIRGAGKAETPPEESKPRT